MTLDAALAVALARWLADRDLEDERLAESLTAVEDEVVVVMTN